MKKLGNLFLFAFCIPSISICRLESYCWLYMHGEGCCAYVTSLVQQNTSRIIGYSKMKTTKTTTIVTYAAQPRTKAKHRRTTKTACCKWRISNFAIVEAHETPALGRCRSKNRPIVICHFTVLHIPFVTYLLGSAQDTSVMIDRRKLKLFQSFLIGV